MNNKKLQELIDDVLKEMSIAGYAIGTVNLYKGIFMRLQKLANERNEVSYTTDLGQTFISDNAYTNAQSYCHSRYCYHSRCVQFIESYLLNGHVDWTPNMARANFSLVSADMQQRFQKFEASMYDRLLKPNTIDGYRRFVFYFLQFLEMRGYRKVDELREGDIIEFITLVCSERYQPTSLGAHLPGLKLFLSMSNNTAVHITELPEHLPKTRAILEVYSDDEYDTIISYINKSDAVSLRNKAICIVALKTGLRAVDICALKLSDINWEHDFIHITQQKTARSHDIPLTSEIGNALIDYILDERPTSDSDYVFLRNQAPFHPLFTHASCWKILHDIVSGAGVISHGRPFGTRITRHSTASRMLRHGVPLAVISEALGHSNPDGVLIYLTTDNLKLSECTLPLPRKVVTSNG